MAAPAAAALDEALTSWLGARPKVRVLDVAAGSGLYGFTLAKHPNVQLTSLDWPNVLQETKEWATAHARSRARPACATSREISST